MLFRNVVIQGLAYELAPHRISSAVIEEQIASTMARLGMQPGLLEGLTGIRERRFWDPGVMPSDVATLAARKLIDQTGINPGQIGCLINSSVSKDYIEPSVACLVHGNLGLSPYCINYDISNACLGFLDAMISIGLMIEAGLIRYGMVVDGESSREVNEATIKRLQEADVSADTFRDNFATLTLGSGAVAMLLCHKNVARSGHLLNGAVSLAATQHNRLCFGQRDFMQTQPTALMTAGVKLAGDTWRLAHQTLPNWSDATIDLYAPHQVSTRNMEALNKALGITPAKLHLNLYTQGNIGPAALPITLAMANDAGRLDPGHHVALMGIGSGLNCSMMSVTW